MTKHFSLFLGDGERPTLTFPNAESMVFPKREDNQLVMGCDFENNGCEASNSDRVLLHPMEIVCNPEVYRAKFAGLSPEETAVKLHSMTQEGLQKCVALLDEYIDRAIKLFVEKYGRQPDTLVTLWRTGPTILTANDPMERRETYGFSIFMNMAFAVCSGIPKECEGLSETPRLSIGPAPLISDARWLEPEDGQIWIADSCLSQLKFEESQPVG